MNSRDLAISVGNSSMRAYLSQPQELSGPHPAVIVLHEVFGFNPEVRRVVDLLPSIGYAGLAIDLYHRSGPQQVYPYTEEGNRAAFGAAARLAPAEILENVRAAAEWLRVQPFVKDGKIALWGFGFGAGAALIASSLETVRGAVCFYPWPLFQIGEARAPLLLVFGEEDYYVSRHDMERIAAELRAAGKEARVQTYPQVGHSFFRHGRPEAIAEHRRYSDEAIATAVADSWNLVQAFLRDIFNRQSRASESGDIHTPRTQATRS